MQLRHAPTPCLAAAMQLRHAPTPHLATAIAVGVGAATVVAVEARMAAEVPFRTAGTNLFDKSPSGSSLFLFGADALTAFLLANWS